MNYRHAFHAGNFADVAKHVVLVRILLYLARKATPYRVIDTHAGAGRYPLDGGAADRTQEWREGIARLDSAALSPAARDLVAPYVEIVGAAAQGRAPYPGSPMIALALARPFDRAIFCELHPEAAAGLRGVVGKDRRAKVIEIDGYTGLNAFIPPVERRGLVLLDPPFEAEDEFERLAQALVGAHRKWREGILLAWHPIKDRRGAERLAGALAQAGIADVLRLEFSVAPLAPGGRLAACGLFVVNPPYVLAQEMACLLPELARQLGQGAGGARIAELPNPRGG